MIVLINGSFGVGKTTVAGLLREAFAGSAVYDPEWAGLGLMRLPKWIGLRGAGTDDFQDIDLWRKSVVAGVRLFRLYASGVVFVPMAFTRRDYFDEVVAGLRRLDPALRVFCLRASLPTVERRLAGRGVRLAEARDAWVARRIVECDAAHRDPHFGEAVETEDRSAREVTTEIARRLRQPDEAVV
jgi:broad-specificity NMP kinase